MLGIIANGITWEICPKKKYPGINQCGEKGDAGGFTYPPEMGEKKEKKKPWY